MSIPVESAQKCELVTLGSVYVDELPTGDDASPDTSIAPMTKNVDALAVRRTTVVPDATLEAYATTASVVAPLLLSAVL